MTGRKEAVPKKDSRGPMSTPVLLISMISITLVLLVVVVVVVVVTTIP